MALALCALMLSLPAQAVRVPVTTYQELFSAMTMGKINDYYLVDDDTISVDREINWSHFEGTYLVVPSNRTRNLDLNGFTLRYSTSNAQYSCAITMRDNSVLNIYDSKGGGQFICLASTNLATLNSDYDQFKANNSCLYGVSNGVVNMSEGNNSVLNIYGGTFQATIGDNSSHNKYTSVTYHCPNVLQESWIESQTKFKTNTVNIYGGHLSSIRNEYGSPYYDFDQHTLIRKPIFSNEKVTINLYGGELGDANATFPGLTYYKGFNGELKEGTIYGISSTDHLNNFANVTSTGVYINGTKSTVSALRTQDLNDKTVRFAYEPEISVSGVEVTKDNCTDIMPWEEFKASFDYATNTLYLKTLSNPTNVLNGIQFADFDLRIVVDGYWRINGSIVGTNGDLTITSNHFALTEEDGDALVMKPGDNTAITLPDHRLTLTNRVRLLCYNNESGHTAQSAVKCHDMWVNNSWFDAWGKKPIVDCAYGSVVNATIKTGSFKNNDVIQVEPQFTQYYIFVQTNGDERGEVTGKGIYNEGTELTISATPKSGYYFDRWYEDGCIDATRTITVTQNATYTALFFPEEVINYYTIDIKTEDVKKGLVSGPTGTFEEGTKLTFEAIPASGYQFLYWKNAQNQVVPGSEVLNWTVTADEILTAHFRVAPPADAYNLWVCGTRVTGSNSNDILGDGVWNYDHENRVLTAMNHATYNISNDGFIQDLESSSGPLTVVLDYNIDVTCTTTDNTFRAALMTMEGMTFTGSTFHGLNLDVKDMYAGNMSGDLTITGHIDFTVFLSTLTTWGQNTIAKALLLGKNLIVNGATVDIGTSESTYKVSDKTNSNLQLTNAEIISGALDQRSLYISDISPKYEINYLTPSMESLCAVGGFNSYFEGTYVTLRAYPAPGYKFVSWSDGNTDNPRLIIMPAQNVYLDPIVELDESIVPKGAIINANVTEGQGTITNFTSGWYAEGTELTITAEPAAGYEFVQWSDGHETNPYYLTVEDGKNINITALFCEKGQGIENIQVEGDQPQKIMMDGILYIVREGKIYNAQGAKVK